MSGNVLENYVNDVQNLSQQGNFTQLSNSVNKDIEILIKNAALLDNAMATFNVQDHSLGILGILVAKFSVSPGSVDLDSLLATANNFINSCNWEQVRYATDLFAEFCHKLKDVLIEKKQAIRGIQTFAKAVQKIQLSPTQLTSIHADLCQLCLTAKCLKPALQFLDIDVTCISKENGHFDAKHFLLYYYYGGMIYAAVKNFKRAAFFFEIAITTPSLAMSQIMLEAYKKYILVSLIEYGKLLTLPRYTSHVVTRSTKTQATCQPYLDLAQAFVYQSQDLNVVVIKHTDIFNSDQNMGLVKQCVKASYKRSIQCLTKTFMTLSFNDMASRVQLSSAAAAENYILNMIEDKEIFATINQRDGMVSFHDNPEKYNSALMLGRISEQLQKCVKVDRQLKAMDEEIMLTPQYMQKVAGMCDEDGAGVPVVKITSLYDTIALKS